MSTRPTPPPPPAPTRVTLLVAHGSRNPAAQLHHEALCERVQAAADQAGTGSAEDARTSVVPAYLELAEPSIPAAIDSAIAAGATHVRLVPHFLGPGNHVMVDIPEIVAAARQRHPGIEVELSEYLGADPALIDLLAARVVA